MMQVEVGILRKKAKN